MLYRKIFKNSPVGMVLCDSAGQAVEANDAICKIVGATKEQLLAQNYHNLESWKKSGLSDTANTAVSSGKAATIKTTMTTSFGKDITVNVNILPFADDTEEYVLFTFDDLAEVKKIEDERERLIEELQKVIEEVRTLRGILPICSFCKKVRDDKGYWERVDVYITKHSLADISHGICPDCLKKYYPDAKKTIRDNTEEDK